MEFIIVSDKRNSIWVVEGVAENDQGFETRFDVYAGDDEAYAKEVSLEIEALRLACAKGEYTEFLAPLRAVRERRTSRNAPLGLVPDKPVAEMSPFKQRAPWDWYDQLWRHAAGDKSTILCFLVGYIDENGARKEVHLRFTPEEQSYLSDIAERGCELEKMVSGLESLTTRRSAPLTMETPRCVAAKKM